MTEAIITREWKQFIDKNPPVGTETWELKLVNAYKTPSFVFDRVAEHQIKGLLASLDALWFKIPDNLNYSPSRGARLPSKKPFDVVYIKAHKASVVVIFYFPRKYKFAIKIPITTFVKLKSTWPRKSIRMEQLAKFPGVETSYL